MIQFPVQGRVWEFDAAPNECPICHHAIDARFLAGVVCALREMIDAEVEVVFQCPRSECQRAFIGRYVGKYDRSRNQYPMHLRATAPYNPPPPTHPEEVSTLSPQFVAVFAQARAAEAWGLGEIAGCGYRRALEFLVKDYCVGMNPGDADAIKQKFLGKVIEDYIVDVSIKACAKRASWLGNDETHYVRRWEDKDIEDLKTLLTLTESWVNTNLLTAKYMSGMPE